MRVFLALAVILASCSRHYVSYTDEGRRCFNACQRGQYQCRQSCARDDPWCNGFCQRDANGCMDNCPGLRRQ